MSFLRPQRVLCALLSSVLLSVVAGCGIGPAAAPQPITSTFHLEGNVHGGQNPVQFANIYVYVAGKTGNGQAATLALKTARQTDALGNFSINSDYNCVTGDQLYIVAQGGDPGLASSASTNPALVMMAVLGECSQVPNISYLFLNEVTTVAAEWTLAPFIGVDYAHIGASSTNQRGLGNAMLNARQLVDITTGKVATLPATLVSEPQKIYSLANALVSCINSDGTTACAPLFAAATYAGYAAPTDTFQAAYDIVRNPGKNPATVFALGSGVGAAYQGLGSAPKDWTLSLTIRNTALASPTELSVDAGGNAWVSGFNSPLMEFSAQGATLGTFDTGGYTESYGLAIDPSSNVWLTVSEAPSHDCTSGGVRKYSGYNSSTPGTLLATYANDTVEYPLWVAFDKLGNAFLADYGNSTATVMSNSGVLFSSSSTSCNGNTVAKGVGGGSLEFPESVAPDAGGSVNVPAGAWFANIGDSTVTHLDAYGNVLLRVSCCDAANGVAVDAAGNAWVASYLNAQLSQIAPAGTYTNYAGNGKYPVNGQNGGLLYPAAVNIDGMQDVFVANYNAAIYGVGSFSEFAGTAHTTPTGSTVAAGVPLSPNSTYQSNSNTLIVQGGYGLDAGLVQPYTAVPDASGNLWVPDNGSDTVVLFFGIATPVKTPLSPTPTAP
jgi:hypothetical protein